MPYTGSGFAAARANAIARLTAAIISGDDELRLDAQVELDQEHRSGRSPLAGEMLGARLERVIAGRFEDASSAQALGTGLSGDVRVFNADGTVDLIEIKAQLDKSRLSDITQADWVRNETDFLRRLLMDDQDFRSRLSPANLDFLSQEPESDWAAGHLWLCDIGLATDARVRRRVGISDVDTLGQYLGRKHLLHMIDHEDRIHCLGKVPLIQSVLDRPDSIRFSLKRNASSEVAVRIHAGGNGAVVFTYHLYAPSAGGEMIGRHKLHGRLLYG